VATLDPYVQKPWRRRWRSIYQALVNPANISRVELDRAGHTFPSARADARLRRDRAALFVGKCDFDGAGTLLAQMYGKLGAGRRPLRESCANSTRAVCEGFRQRWPRREGPAVRADVLQQRGRAEVPACPWCSTAASRVRRWWVGSFVLGPATSRPAAGTDIVLLFPADEPSYPRPLNPMGWLGTGGGTKAITTRSRTARRSSAG